MTIRLPKAVLVRNDAWWINKRLKYPCTVIGYESLKPTDLQEDIPHFLFIRAPTSQGMAWGFTCQSDVELFLAWAKDKEENL